MLYCFQILGDDKKTVQYLFGRLIHSILFLIFGKIPVPYLRWQSVLRVSHKSHHQNTYASSINQQSNRNSDEQNDITITTLHAVFQQLYCFSFDSHHVETPYQATPVTLLQAIGDILTALPTAPRPNSLNRKAFAWTELRINHDKARLLQNAPAFSLCRNNRSILILPSSHIRSLAMCLPGSSHGICSRVWNRHSNHTCLSY